MNIQVGQIIETCSGRPLKIISIDSKGGFTVERPDTGSTQKISAGKLKKCRAVMAQPDFAGFLKQASFTKGGISYTVAEAVGAAYALGLKLSADGKRWVK